MLTQQLRELELDGIITRTVFDRVPPKVVYDINEPERQPLESLLAALCDWGLYWCDKTVVRNQTANPQTYAVERNHNPVN